MTNHFYGSSLFQAPKTDHVHHRHSHYLHGRSLNNHLRSHAHFHRRQEENETADLDQGDTIITEVVQTISVVQVIDGSGAIIETQTLASEPQTNLIDAETGSTIDPKVKAVSPTPDSPGAATALSPATETSISAEDPVSPTPETPPPAASPSDASLTATTITSVPPGETTDATTIVPTLSLPPNLSSSSSFPSLSSTFNSTTSSLTSSSSSLLSSSSSRSNSTITSSTSSGSSTASQSLSSLVTSLSSSFAADSISGTASSSFSSSTSGSSSVTTSSSGAFSTSSDSDSLSPSPSPTFGIGGGDGSAGTSILATPSSSSTSLSPGASSDDGPPPTGTVVGGVVGGVAGLALLVAFAFMLLRLRKRGWCHLPLGGDDKSITPATRAVGPGPSGDGSGGGGGSGAYGTMQQQRSSAPYSVASSLAALAGKRSSRERSNTGSEMAERGFVRVSGKKLPPVLQYGGDGYSDPRDRSSQNSDATVYRDSMAIFNQVSTPQRLALGSPMRPESGVMVFNPGPAKTPVTGEVPKTLDSPTLPRNSMLPPGADDVGRTLAAQDHSRDGAASRTSRGSARFTENLS
ncbi:hypothetical protein KVR01_011423 [Diaporthe batatas]|uniref:uncharacterized protein n=1 Tax=Diaporthe batatas TaxID=748121 RepID=UPI001D03E2CC|nr:uncharacterized protein KVR01_011423 [Diaporthe batatas]KAG8158980.1 hypothetical protein KVR01_011423 [Diaporthe batatas]